jgi:hypothetical protein
MAPAIDRQPVRMKMLIQICNFRRSTFFVAKQAEDVKISACLSALHILRQEYACVAEWKIPILTCMLYCFFLSVSKPNVLEIKRQI